ncbi:MAG: hypothetical protein ACFFCO_02555 [Promethearchaeota archaeon]
MGIGESIRGFPAAALKAVKDYFTGLGLFFNRQTWSHGVVFIVVLAFFLVFHIFQRLLVSFFQAIVSLVPTVGNIVALIYLSGCAVFLGFLLLGVIAITSWGRNLLYTSRFRHVISPLVIGGLILFFITVIPFIISRTPASIKETSLTWLLVGQNGMLNFVYRGCWIVMVFLQVVLIGYTVIKSLKWLWSYVKAPEYRGTAVKHRIGTILILLLVPVVIFVWPILISLLLIGINPLDPSFISSSSELSSFPVFNQLPFYVQWLITFDSTLCKVFLTGFPLLGAVIPEFFGRGYQLLLLFISPVIFITSIIVLWRGRSQLALALASFGVLYSALVFYFHYQVYQYFLNWLYIWSSSSPRPQIGTAIFEIAMILITFLMCLQAVAKYQRDVSPNPFGLFALMIGTLVFFQMWMINPGPAAWMEVEAFSMASAALSTLLATITFAALPLGYSIFRLIQHPEQ